ncbi:hypothetical protein ACM26V_13435 [Salipaludibacillus sp. HK11]|uniref:hypothetical protein n=1 Tax=Salipaludibacillus sp. HK11 TaxID=3394320 RepID=UPI0039FDC069
MKDNPSQKEKSNIQKKQFVKSKGYKCFLIFTYLITLPFLGMVVAGNIGWMIASVIGFTGAFIVWKK